MYSSFQGNMKILKCNKNLLKNVCCLDPCLEEWDGCIVLGWEVGKTIDFKGPMGVRGGGEGHL